MLYVNRFGQGQRETVSENASRQEALRELREYRHSDPSAYYYLSTRCCKAWREK